MLRVATETNQKKKKNLVQKDAHLNHTLFRFDDSTN